MISSRVQTHSRKVAVPLAIKSAALPSHTSVPWDRPLMRSNSATVVGFVSFSMFIANSVPNSGIPNTPKSNGKSGSLISNASQLRNKDNVPGSSSGTSTGSIPVNSYSLRITVGLSCPNTSSFTNRSCRELKSKCVVMVSLSTLSAGLCNGV